MSENLRNDPPKLVSPVSWVLLAFLLYVVLRLVFVGPNMLGDPDTFLHVAIGDWIRLHQSVPKTDPFSYPMHGQPWVAHEWLAGVLFSCAYQAAGWYGLCVLSVLACGLTMAVLGRFLLDRLPPVYAMLLVVLAAVGLESHLLGRPHVLAWPILAIWVGSLLNAAEEGKNPNWRLLPLMVLWANLHGSFVMGLAFILPLGLESVLSCAASKRHHVLKNWILFGGLAVLCALLTPYGFDGLSFASNLVSIEALSSISEWMPTNAKGNPILLIWLGLLLIGGLSGYLKLPPIRLILLLGLGWQMFMHRRFFSIFSLLVPFLIAAPLAHSQRTWAAHQHPSSKVDKFLAYLSGKSCPQAMVLATALIGVAIVLAYKPDLYPKAENAPRAAWSYLKDNGFSRHGLNSYNYGGFLIWSGVPVYMDGRIDLRGDKGMKAYDRAVAGIKSEGLLELLDEYQIEWTLFPVDSFGALHMDRVAGWRRVFEDEASVVHAR